MTVTRGLALVLTAAVAGVAGGRPGTAADTPAAPSAKLKSISERAGRTGRVARHRGERAGAVLTTRPDPLTVLLDFRNVGAEGVTNALAAKRPASLPTSSSSASNPWACRGARPDLAGEPIAHVVRSDRNSVVVEFDRNPRAGVPYVHAGACRGPARRDAGARPGRCASVDRSDRRAAATVSAAAAGDSPSGVPRAGCAGWGGSGHRGPPAAAERRARRAIRSSGRAAASTTATPITLDFQQADLRARAARVQRDQRPQHRHRSDGAGLGRRRVERRAVGPGARHHPARQQARVHRRRHDRPDRAADRARRRGIAAPEACGRAGARRPAAGADQDAQLRARRRLADALDAQRAVTARHRPDRSADQHAHHHRPVRSSADRHAADRHARQGAAAGRDRGAHRPDQPQLRARSSACNGASTDGPMPRSATRRTSRSRTTVRWADAWVRSRVLPVRRRRRPRSISRSARRRAASASRSVR